MTMHRNAPVIVMYDSRGVDLIRVSYIPDSKADIKEAVLDSRRRVGPGGWVFTSGGIGPTHDDVTYEAIAEAMGETDTTSGCTVCG